MAPRFLYLIRHGQYETANAPDERGGGLTELGKLQAQHTAERLRWLEVRCIHHSSLRRASQTARILARGFPGVPLRPSRLLWETIPVIPPGYEAQFGDRVPEGAEEQAAQAFERYFKPAREPRLELIVAHGNLIRYFVCRALGLPPEAWLRMEMHHCGISQVVVLPDGRPHLIAHNDTGHLPYAIQTLS
ncbi:phosphoglycerate mutase GpmB [Calidithermus terrae]|uniref:Phosphoglycerate mutase GpmB n=1 Tax=Calidithermus terrae TaxID=1408545 RepID=A0A399EFQ8_9DEIN|nr:histidine phosphatase family protein [Calidithermus terrae]RIH82995.1 phosphoglycerate mutase GpmB [Calidithermus terrae]